MARKKHNPLLDVLFASLQADASARKDTPQWVDKAQALRASLRPVQAVLEADPSRRKAVRSPRQTGKSTGVMLIVSIRCLERALSEWVVICITRESAQSIYWAPLQRLNKTYELGLKFNNQALKATFPNGSTIRFVGMDNLGEIEKLRGGRYSGVVVDESKSYPVLLFDELVHQVLEPALMANNGELILIGTPGDSLRGTFYAATCDEPIVYFGTDGKTPTRQSNVRWGTTSDLPAKWSFHRWILADNVQRYVDETGRSYTMWDQAQELMRQNGWTRETPEAAREYFGDWIPADEMKPYRYRPEKHDYDPKPDHTSAQRHVRWGLPDMPGEFKTILGVDLGTRDGTAMVVWAWNIYTNHLWEVYSDKRRADKAKGERLPLSEIAAWYHELQDEYGPFEGQVVDPGGLATLSIDTLADDHHVYLEPAEKREKNDHIEVMNNDFDRGLIHIRRGSLLSDELDKDRWDPRKLENNKKVENANIPNDAADAGLYSYRWARHRRPAAPPRPDNAGTAEWLRAEMANRLREKQQAGRDALNNAGQLDRDWWEGDTSRTDAKVLEHLSQRMFGWHPAN